MYLIQKNKACNATFLLAKQKRCLAVLIGLAMASNTFSQKEVFFDNTPKESVKVQTFRGLELGYKSQVEPRFFTDILGGYADPYEYFQAFHLSYFKEYQLLSTVSLILKGGLILTPTPSFITSSPMGGLILGYKYYNRYGVVLSAEPRWYYGFKKRFVEGKANLNSGGFFTMPLEYTSHTNPSVNSWVTIHMSPQWGYRKALFNKLYIEGMLGCSLSTQQYLYSYSIDNVIHVYPTASLKIGYAL